MAMARLQFFKNKYRYPHYSPSITPYGLEMDCTPVGINFKGGTIRVKGDMLDFMSCNYLTFEREGVTLYAWIDDVQFRTEDSFDVKYSVDAWRTYKTKIDLGKQFISRSQLLTYKQDRLLGSEVPQPHIETKTFIPYDIDQRVLVVQVKTAPGEQFSQSPVNPSPYQFYMTKYDTNDWLSNPAIVQLVNILTNGSETTNIVTMYSIPYMDLSGLASQPLVVKYGANSDSATVETGFFLLGAQNPIGRLRKITPITFDYDVNLLMRVDHSVKLVIPEAGILDIPDQLLVKGDLALRQDIDLFSGASNYMLMSGQADYYSYSVRGSSISSIPIVSDPMDTYISQNQNALATSLIGDVASMTGGALAGGAMGGVPGAVGGALMSGGATGSINTTAKVFDSGSKASNPPAFLGTALASNFNQKFWVVTTKTDVSTETATAVHEKFGYPLGVVKDLVFPTDGFIQTEGCTVSSTDGSVPSWAIEEVNKIFDNGLLVHPS